MAHIVADRVKETASTTGTGTFTLAGAVSAFRTFASVMATSDTTWYCAVNGTEWEVGLGTLASSTTLARSTVLASSNAGAAVNFTVAPTVFGTIPAKEISPIKSSVRVNTANGYGSTNTKIRRFTNVGVNQGTDITYADSAANGGSFTINAHGVYAIDYSDSFNGAAGMGASLNSSQLTTAFGGIAVADRLSYATTPTANFSSSAGATAFLVPGDVVRAHTGGDPAAGQASIFSITRVG